MPVFQFKGVDAKGKQQSGMRDADNLRTLRANLRKEGIFVTDAKEASLRAKEAGEVAADIAVGMINPKLMIKRMQERQKASQLQIAVLTRQLGTLLKAGVPLAESLGALVDQIDQIRLKRVLADVKTQVNEGSSLADAMGRHGDTFEELYVNMVRAGEASGALDVVLFRLSDFLDAQNKLSGKVTSALFYPIVMAVIAVGVIAMLMITVVPKVTTIFADTGKALPWNTQMLISVSTFMADYWFTLPPFFGGLAYAFRRWQRTPAGRERFDRLKLKLPVFGNIARRVAIARFARTLATLLASGVQLLKALDVVKPILGNTVLIKVIEEAKKAIQEGESIAAPLKRSGEFPPVVTHMVAVGERSGQLEQMLINIADAYDIEVDLAIGRLTSLLEPIMILIMGGTVGFVLSSVLSPIMEMNEFVG